MRSLCETMRRKEIVVLERGAVSRSRRALKRIHVRSITQWSAFAHTALRPSTWSPNDVTGSAYTGALEARLHGSILVSRVTTIASGKLKRMRMDHFVGLLNSCQVKTSRRTAVLVTVCVTAGQTWHSARNNIAASMMYSERHGVTIKLEV